MNKTQAVSDNEGRHIVKMARFGLTAIFVSTVVMVVKGLIQPDQENLKNKFKHRGIRARSDTHQYEQESITGNADETIDIVASKLTKRNTETRNLKQSQVSMQDADNLLTERARRRIFLTGKHKITNGIVSDQLSKSSAVENLAATRTVHDIRLKREENNGVIDLTNEQRANDYFNYQYETDNQVYHDENPEDITEEDADSEIDDIGQAEESKRNADDGEIEDDDADDIEEVDDEVDDEENTDDNNEYQAFDIETADSAKLRKIKRQLDEVLESLNADSAGDQINLSENSNQSNEEEEELDDDGDDEADEDDDDAADVGAVDDDGDKADVDDNNDDDDKNTLLHTDNEGEYQTDGDNSMAAESFDQNGMLNTNNEEDEKLLSKRDAMASQASRKIENVSNMVAAEDESDNKDTRFKKETQLNNEGQDQDLLSNQDANSLIELLEKHERLSEQSTSNAAV